MGGFLWGLPRKLIRRVTEIEIDTHYYDTDVVPSAQDIFTYSVNEILKTSEITGFISNNISQAVIPYRIKYGDSASHMFANVTTISSGAFKNNSHLTDMTIPNTINIIPSECFMNCNHLLKINIPKSIKTISSKAFQGCSDLKQICIPYTVTTIQTDASKDCTNLKIICYKHSTAEEYAKANNITYSLISYSIDAAPTIHSENLVTSGTIHSVIQSLNGKIYGHINNKINPHDDSKFNNANLIGLTTIANGILNQIKETPTSTPQDVQYDDKSLVNVEYVSNQIREVKNPTTGSEYQKIVDNTLSTDSKTIPAAINEINDKSYTITGSINSANEWTTIELNKTYPISWTFLNNPYFYTNDGITVSFRIRNKTNHSFDVFVPCECNYTFSVTNSDEISGYPIDYALITYYYTGIDGTDLDTVTGIENDNWPSYINKTVGYSHGNSISYNGIELIRWGGDNRGGGTNESQKYYETIYFNIGAIQNILPNEDIDIILYGTWYTAKNRGNVFIKLDCFESSTVPIISVNDGTKILSLSNLIPSTGHVNPVYTNNELVATVATRKGSPTNFKKDYTPIFKITLKKNESNYRNIEIKTLS